MTQYWMQVLGSFGKLIVEEKIQNVEWETDEEKMFVLYTNKSYPNPWDYSLHTYLVFIHNSKANHNCMVSN